MRFGAGVCDVDEDPGSEPDVRIGGVVALQGEGVGCGGGVECPCFWGGGEAGGGDEVVGVY